MWRAAILMALAMHLNVTPSWGQQPSPPDSASMEPTAITIPLPVTAPIPAYCSAAPLRTSASRARTAVAAALQAQRLSISDIGGRQTLSFAPSIVETALLLAIDSNSPLPFRLQFETAMNAASRDAVVQGVPLNIGDENRAILDAAFALCPAGSD